MSRNRTLLVGLAAMVLLPVLVRALGLGVNTATQIVTLAIAALGLNLLVGFTGLTSFGHSAWFGIGAYAAAISQKHWFAGQIGLPIVFSVACVALLSFLVGLLILRRRGVYFALLTLAFVALTYTIAFRWTELTGGEDGLGGLARGGFRALPLDNHTVYYAFVALVAFGVLYGLLRVTRSPFGHVLVAIRENQQRATFQGYDVDRYRLGAFVLSAVVTGLGGALQAFLNYLVSAESVSVAFSGELLAMVVIGGMHQLLGPGLGVWFYVAFRVLFSMWTGNWLLWFGLVFVGFVLFSPEGLAGIWAKMRRRLRPPPEESAAMSRRKIYEGLPLPAFLRPELPQGAVLELAAVRSISASAPWAARASPCARARSTRSSGPTARARPRCSTWRPACSRRTRARCSCTARRCRDRSRTASASRASRARSRSRTCSRASPSTRTCASRCRPGTPRASTPGATWTASPRSTPRPGSWRSSWASKASKRSRAASSPTAASAWWTWASRLAPSRACCCWMSRSRASRPPSASACPAW
jgi:ABC-type branched-subunit amino acid transport system permease subunit